MDLRSRCSREAGRQTLKPARNLLQRLAPRQDEVHAYRDDLTTPFAYNQAERDLRRLEVQQKVFGCFRSCAGADAFACPSGYLATMRKQGQVLLATFATVVTGQPRYPDVLHFGAREDRQIRDAVSSYDPCERGLFGISVDL